MTRSVVTATACLLLLAAMAPVAAAQITLVPMNGGNGSDGPFSPASNTTLNTDTQSVYNFTTMTIPAGVTVTLTGSLPCTIKVQGAVLIDGTLNGSGLPGMPGGNNAVGGVGGAGGPGGGAGGEAGGGPNVGSFVGTGNNGTGPGGGQGGVDGGLVGGSFTDPVGGGGGGGNATPGMSGGTPNAGTTPSASGMGGPAVSPCRAGSGGGGGGADIDSSTSATSNDGGGGGGGGGGRICLFADGNITVSMTGSILAKGGDGGTSTGNGGAGGGGSGGSIELVAPIIIVDGALNALGGAGGAATQTNCGCSPGGAGGDGCILVCGTATGAGLLGATPVPTFDASACQMVTAACPVAAIAVNGTPPDTYVAALSSALGPPINVGPGSVLLAINDPLFALTFPVNAIPNIVGGLTGLAGAGTIGVNLSGIVPPNTDLTVYAQALGIGAGGAISRVSNVVTIRIKF